MDKDARPFGYTFDGYLGDSSPTQFTHGGPSLLSETENQSLNDFFSNTDPFFTDPAAFPAPADFKDSLDDFNWAFVPPATIHRVSTTIPDQAQLQNNFNAEPVFSPDPLSAPHHLANTQDDLQAASTLFNNAHASQINFGRSYSMPGMATSTNGMSNGHAQPHPQPPSRLPMVPTPSGLMNEQLAAVLPHHSANGSVDATIVAAYAQRHHAHVHVQESERRPQLKRVYTYGTDASFGHGRYAPPSPLPTEDDVVKRMLEVIPPTIKQETPKRKGSAAHGDISPSLVGYQNDDEGPSEEESSDEDGNLPMKKRRKSSKAHASLRKGVSGARGRDMRKASVDVGKKKRGSTAGQKRENLTDEQKRSNHILSEQKRRNLIKRGFDDLHDLVPAIRSGGLSKSAILTEAADFLEKIIEDNRQFKGLAGLPDD